MGWGNPDRSSRFVPEPDGRLSWRQTLDWRGAHIVDHGGLLWVWQPHGGYRLCMLTEVFYDLSAIYDDS